MAQKALQYNILTGETGTTPPLVEVADTTAVPEANKVVRAGADGLIDVGWLPTVGTAPQLGLRAEYWPNINHTGSPTVIRTESQVSFAAAPSGVGPTNFSAKFTGYLRTRYTETYTLTLGADDGYRLFVEGVQVISNWTDHGYVETSVTVEAVAGEPIAIEVHWYNGSGGCALYLKWASASQGLEVVPASCLSTTEQGLAQGPATGDLAGDYPNPTVARLRGRAVSPLSPALGQALVWDGLEWAPADVEASGGSGGGGAGSGGSYSYFDVMAPPTVASALDDEFEGSTLAGWTQVNWNLLGSWDVNSSKRSALWVQRPAGEFTTNMAALLKAIPAGDFTVYTEMVIATTQAEYPSMGLILSDGVTAGAGNQTMFMIHWNTFANFWGIYIQNWTGFGTSYLANITPGANGYGGNVHPYRRIFLRMRRAGTTYSFASSVDGETWLDHALAASVTASPTHFGLYFQPRTPDHFEGSFGFFRYFPSASAGLGNMRVFGGGSGGASGVWSPDVPPTLASALDDEFTGSTLGPAWSLHNAAASPSASVRQGAVHIAAASYGGQFTGIERAIPDEDAVYIIPVELNSAFDGGNFAGGLALLTSTGAKVTWCLIDGQALDLSSWSSHTSYSGSSYRRASPSSYGDRLFLAIKKTGTTYEFWSSSNGSNWLKNFTTVIAGVTGIALGVYANASQQLLSVGWFRRIAMDVLGGEIAAATGALPLADQPPAVAAAQSDEFDGSALAAKWTTFGSGVTRAVGAPFPSHYVQTSTGAVNPQAGIYQAVAGSMRVTAKLGIGGRMLNFLYGGIHFSAGALGSTAAASFNLQWAEVNGVDLVLSDASGGFAGRVAQLPLNVTSIYARLEYVPGEIRAYYSTDGLSWLHYGSAAISWTPTRWGLHLGCTHANPTQLICDWVRVEAL